MDKSFDIPKWRYRVRDQVQRFPLAAFLILAYTISWEFWLLFWLTGPKVGMGLFIAGAAGPAVAGMVIAALLRPERSVTGTKKRLKMFVVFWVSAVTVLEAKRVWDAARLTTVVGKEVAGSSPLSFTALLLDLFAAAVIAYLFSGVWSPTHGVREYLKSLSLKQVRVKWYWLPLAVGLYPTLIGVGNTVSRLAGAPAAALKVSGPWYWVAVDVIIIYLYTLLGGGGLEEPGWRGFALPVLQKKHSPLRASFILAVAWAFWHWPMFWLGYYGGGPLGVFAYTLGVVPVAVLFTSAYNRTGGSLPVVILLHTTVNVTPIFLPITPLASGLWMLVNVGLLLWMWRSPQAFLLEECP